MTGFLGSSIAILTVHWTSRTPCVLELCPAGKRNTCYVRILAVLPYLFRPSSFFHELSPYHLLTVWGRPSMTGKVRWSWGNLRACLIRTRPWVLSQALHKSKQIYIYNKHIYIYKYFNIYIKTGHVWTLQKSKVTVQVSVVSFHHVSSRDWTSARI